MNKEPHLLALVLSFRCQVPQKRETNKDLRRGFEGSRQCEGAIVNLTFGAGSIFEFLV